MATGDRASHTEVAPSPCHTNALSTPSQLPYRHQTELTKGDRQSMCHKRSVTLLHSPSQQQGPILLHFWHITTSSGRCAG